MNEFIHTLSRALFVGVPAAERGVALVLDTLRSGAHPEDWGALLSAVPEAYGLLDAERWRRSGRALLAGPPPQDPAGLSHVLHGMGLDADRGTLLAGFTVRFLATRIEEPRLVRLLARAPALALVRDAADGLPAEPVLDEGVGPPGTAGLAVGDPTRRLP